jgi:hypothetical protein
MAEQWPSLEAGREWFPPAGDPEIHSGLFGLFGPARSGAHNNSDDGGGSPAGEYIDLIAL